MTRTQLSAVLSLLALAVGAGPAMADIYSYKDERGVVHFTNMPNGDKRFKLVRKEERPGNGQPSVGAARVAQLFMPAQADIQQYFRVTPPSVHQMVLTLERAGFIRRQPGAARSIEVLVDPKLLPELL